jgi:hypothetical protein
LWYLYQTQLPSPSTAHGSKIGLDPSKCNIKQKAPIRTLLKSRWFSLTA